MSFDPSGLFEWECSVKSHGTHIFDSPYLSFPRLLGFLHLFFFLFSVFIFLQIRCCIHFDFCWFSEKIFELTDSVSSIVFIGNGNSGLEFGNRTADFFLFSNFFFF